MSKDCLQARQTSHLEQMEPRFPPSVAKSLAASVPIFLSWSKRLDQSTKIARRNCGDRVTSAEKPTVKFLQSSRSGR